MRSVINFREGDEVMQFSTVILAAGSGSRCDLGYNKMFYPIEENQTIIEKTVSVFEGVADCSQIVLVINKEDEDKMRELFDERVEYAYGGNTRQASSLNGLAYVRETYVMIHDGARPYVSEYDIMACAHTLESEEACLLVTPLKDTLKRILDGKVIETLPREQMFHALTPQCFKTTLIKRCLGISLQEGIVITDDASAVELCSSVNVVPVLGDDHNIKITTKADLK